MPSDRAQPDPVPRPRGGRFDKLARAKWRHALITRGADRLTGGKLVERHLAEPIVSREILVQLPHWPRDLDGLTVAHFTDLHFGELMPPERVDEIAERLSVVKPDVVAFTGDAVDLEPDGIDDVFRRLAAVPAPGGHLLVLGNHDHLRDADAVLDAARAAGIRPLVDERISIDLGRSSLEVAGVDWARTVPECSARVRAVCREPVELLLAHNPKCFLEAARQHVPLTLSGHTHGGQLARRDKPRQNLAMTARLSAGFYERRGSALFVSTGVGAWFPLRVHCPPEVVFLTLRHGPWRSPIG